MDAVVLTCPICKVVCVNEAGSQYVVCGDTIVSCTECGKRYSVPTEFQELLLRVEKKKPAVTMADLGISLY